MKKFSTLLLLSAALFAFAPSDTQADCCYDSCDCMDVDVKVDFLWWKPCVGDLSYAAELDKSDFKIKSVCPDREPGVRVSLVSKNFLFGWELGASYTYLNSCSSSSVEKKGKIVSVNSHPGFITSFFDEGKGTWTSRYSEWDVLLTFDNSCDSCHELTHSFGIAGIKLDQKLVELLENSSNQKQQTTWNSDFWGVGFRAGSNYTRRLTDCITFYANGNGTILVGNVDSSIKFDSQDSDTQSDHTFTEGDNCHIVPGYHLGTGFTYDTCICNYDVSVRLGYEFLAWHNLPSHRTFVKDGGVTSNEGAISTSSNTRLYGFHGLHAGVQLSF